MKKPIEPFLGNPPIAPSEHFDREAEIDVPLYSALSLKELENYLPDNVFLNDLKFEYRDFGSGEYDSNYHMVVFYLVKELNLSYKKQLKKYEEDCKIYEEKKLKYNEVLLQYKKDLKEYNNHLKEAELKKLKKRLSQLEKKSKE